MPATSDWRAKGNRALVPSRPWLLSVLIVFAANGLFLGLNVAGSAAPVGPLVKRIRTAFEAGALGPWDWRAFDSRRGYNQYNDCMILLFSITRDAGVLSRALGPLWTVRNEDIPGWPGYCITLNEMVHGDEAVSQYKVKRYTRYWHGYLPISVALLQAFELSQVRRLLKIGVYAALILLVFATGTHQPGLLLVSVPIVVTGVLFWAVPQFGQSLCHGPGDAFVIIGLACLLFWRERLLRLRMFVPFCAAYGAGVVYLEFLTGLLPTVAGLLLPIVYLVAVTRPDYEDRPRLAWRFAAAGLAAFVLGAALTVMIKQILAVLFVDTGAVDSFSMSLQQWTGAYEGSSSLLGGRFLVPLSALWRRRLFLTYGSVPGAVALFGSTALAWVAAGWLAFRSATTRLRSDFLAFAAGASVIVVWTMAFPTHTIRHLWMVRILIVPIALGWGALLWQLKAAAATGHRVFR
jgi:hypothetical protein